MLFICQFEYYIPLELNDGTLLEVKSSSLAGISYDNDGESVFSFLMCPLKWFVADTMGVLNCISKSMAEGSDLKLNEEG